MSVSLFQTNAKLSTLQEPVNHVMLDTTSTMEFVFLPPLRKCQTKDVELGTGKIKSVWLAPTTGSSTNLENVSPSQTNAKLSTDQEPVNHATKDTTSVLENAISPPLKSPQTSDVVNGTGTTKSASPALTDLFSVTLEFASPSTITATNGTIVELAPAAMLDTTSTKENVSWVTLFVKNLTQMEPASLATPDTSVTMEAVSLFPNWPHLPSSTPSVVLKN